MSEPDEKTEVPLNSTVTLTSVDWDPQNPKEAEQEEKSESVLDRTFDLETAESLKSPKNEAEMLGSKILTKTRSAPLQSKPKVPPKPAKIVLLTSSSESRPTLLLKKPLRRPKIKSPDPQSQSPRVFGKKTDHLTGITKDKTTSPSASKNLQKSDNYSSSLKRKGSLNNGGDARLGSLRTKQKTDPSLKNGITSREAKAKEMGRKSLAIAGINRSGTNNNQNEAVNRNKTLASQKERTALQVKQRTTTNLAVSKSPATLNSPEVRPRAARTSSITLQNRRKSIGDVIKNSSLSSGQNSLTLPREASNRRKSIGDVIKNSSLSSGQNSLTLPREASKQRKSLSYRDSPLASSSTTPTFTSSSRRNSLDRNVPVKSQLRREISQPAKRLESIKKVKPASTVGARKSNSDGRKKLNTVSDESRKFDVLALVCRQAIEENDKLQKVIKANKLQLENYQAELSHSKEKQKSFTNLLSQLSSDIETMCEKHKDEKEAFRLSQESVLESLKLENQNKLKKLKRDHQAKIMELRQNQESSIAFLKAEHSKELDRVVHDFEEKIGNLEDDRDQHKAEYEKKVTQLETKLSSMEDNMMSGSDVQEGFIKELKQEVESLRAVMEMKDEELRSARLEKESLNQSISSLNESQRKVEALTHKVEDLKGLLEVKKNNERRLDAELLRLEDCVRSQSKDRSRLAQEKEELQWKMKQRMKMCLDGEIHSQSFNDQTEYSREGNFKTFNFQHASLNVTAPNMEHDPSIVVLSPNVSSPTIKKKTVFSSTPSVPQMKESKSANPRVAYHFQCEDD